MNTQEKIAATGNCFKSPPAPKKKRKPLRRVSQKRQGENRKYLKLREEFLRAHPYCMAWGRIVDWAAENSSHVFHTAPDNCPPSEEIHHMKKPRCKYLNEESTWLAVSKWAHRFIENNKSIARRLGLLA